MLAFVYSSFNVMEENLLKWFTSRHLKYVPVSEWLLCDKAQELLSCWNTMNSVGEVVGWKGSQHITALCPPPIPPPPNVFVTAMCLPIAQSSYVLRGGVITVVLSWWNIMLAFMDWCLLDLSVSFKAATVICLAEEESQPALDGGGWTLWRSLSGLKNYSFCELGLWRIAAFQKHRREHWCICWICSVRRH